MIDYHFDKQRARLVSVLRRKGIRDENVLNAIGIVPRELFLDDSLTYRAYEDSALPLYCGQTISQPYTVAYMTEKLEAENGQSVLEIGTGSGYQSCILHVMGCKVYTVERIDELHDSAVKLFRKFGYGIKALYGDGSTGWQEFAPYDRIIVTAAAPELPQSLLEQLKIGGRMVIPIGGSNYQTMTIYIKYDENDIKKIKTDDFKFVPLIGREGWKE